MKVPRDPGTVPGRIMVELPYGFTEELYHNVLMVRYEGAPDLTVGRVRELINSSGQLRNHQRQWWRDRLEEDYHVEDDDDLTFNMTEGAMEWALRHMEEEPPFLTIEECMEESGYGEEIRLFRRIL